MAEARSGAAGQSDEPAETDAGTPPPSGATPEVPPRRGPVAGFRAGLVGAVVFLLGVTLGAVAVGLLSDTALPVPADQADGAQEDGGLFVGDLDPDAGPFQVNGACLGAVNALQDAYATIDDLGQAAAAVDAAQLDEVVRRLQPLQRQLEQDMAACRVSDIDEPSSADPSPGTGSTPSAPTATPSPTD